MISKLIVGEEQKVSFSFLYLRLRTLAPRPCIMFDIFSPTTAAATSFDRSKPALMLFCKQTSSTTCQNITRRDRNECNSYVVFRNSKSKKWTHRGVELPNVNPHLCFKTKAWKTFEKYHLSQIDSLSLVCVSENAFMYTCACVSVYM